MDDCFQCKLCEVQCPTRRATATTSSSTSPSWSTATRRSSSASEGSSSARSLPRRSRRGGAGGARQRRPRQRDEPRRGAPLVPGEGPGHPPRQAAARLRPPRRSRSGPTSRAGSRRRPAARRCCSRPATCRTTSRRSAGHGRGAEARTRSTCAARAACSAAACRPGRAATCRSSQKRASAATSTCSLPFVEKGAKVLAINPTCSMMLRREYPSCSAGGPRAGRAALAAGGARPQRVPLVAARGAALLTRLQDPSRQGRLPRALPPARPGRRLQRPRPHPAHRGARRDRRGRVLRTRRHLRHEGRGLRGVAAHRAEGLRRHAGAGGRPPGSPTARWRRSSSSNTPAESPCTRCRSWPAPTGATAFGAGEPALRSG